MPQRVSCNNCNEMLYEGRDVKPPDEVIRNYEGKCPKCGSRSIDELLLCVDKSVGNVKNNIT